MTFDDYQRQAQKTALPTKNDLLYVALGLANEAGEVAGKLKKWMRDNDMDSSRLDKEALADELGDVLWYLAMMAKHLDISFEAVASRNLEKLASRQRRGQLRGSGDKR